MTICKIQNCPYQEKGQCAKRITSINQMGICIFWKKIQQNRVGTQEFIKKEIAVVDAEISQMDSKDPVNADAASEVKENE